MTPFSTSPVPTPLRYVPFSCLAAVRLASKLVVSCLMPAASFLTALFGIACSHPPTTRGVIRPSHDIISILLTSLQGEGSSKPMAPQAPLLGFHYVLRGLSQAGHLRLSCPIT